MSEAGNAAVIGAGPAGLMAAEVMAREGVAVTVYDRMPTPGRKFLDGHFMLHRKPGTFVAGEMLDWEAPTGGYRLQGCFSTGVAAARGALAWLRSSARD